MNQKIYSEVKELFTDYEDTAELREFIEEITSNLEDRVKDFMAKGKSEQEAYEKAFKELGDITEIADSISRQKRRDVIFNMYMPCVPMKPFHAAGFAICTTLLLIGIVGAVLFALRTNDIFASFSFFASFLTVSIAGFTYLGLTRETRIHTAMKKGRAIAYAVATAMTGAALFFSLAILFNGVTFGAFAFNNIWHDVIYNTPHNYTALILLAALIVPAIALFTFLGLTEKSRLKPHMVKQMEQWTNSWINSDWMKFSHNSRFGILSGALWMLAVAVFLTWGALGGWSISWIVFPFTVALQLALQAFMTKK